MITKNTKPKKTKSFYRSFVTFLIISLLTVSFIRIVVANLLATSGGQLAAVNQKIKNLEEDNLELANQKSELASFGRIEKLTEKKGLVKTKNVQILEPQVPIASK